MFRFKKFSIEDKACAMKIGTDGVLLGAWCSLNSGKCLDIGTGSGLVSLMLAQRFSSIKIDAIDIVDEAILQARENIKNSKWEDRINTFKISLQDYSPSYKYQSIVSNPPFFKENTQIKCQDRNTARTHSSLNPQALAKNCSRLLGENGLVSIIYPYEYYKYLADVFKSNQLYISRLCRVRGNNEVPPKRVLLEFQRVEKKIEETELTIEISRHNYTEEYIQLTKDFYLKM